MTTPVLNNTKQQPSCLLLLLNQLLFPKVHVMNLFIDFPVVLPIVRVTHLSSGIMIDLELTIKKLKKFLLRYNNKKDITLAILNKKIWCIYLICLGSLKFGPLLRNLAVIFYVLYNNLFYVQQSFGFYLQKRFFDVHDDTDSFFLFTNKNVDILHEPLFAFCFFLYDSKVIRTHNHLVFKRTL